MGFFPELLIGFTVAFTARNGMKSPMFSFWLPSNDTSFSMPLAPNLSRLALAM
jgi:hypothetical protein